MTRFTVLAATSERVASTTKRTVKVATLAETLAALAPEEVEPAAAFLVGETRFGRIGVGWAAIAAIDAPPAAHPTWEILDVDAAIADIARQHGPGSAARRAERLTALFGAATDAEQRLLRGILGGELRQGALEGVMVSAVASAAAVPVAAVRRAAMFTGDLALAARLACVDGRAALDAVTLQPLRPVGPMLASPAASIEEALGGTTAAAPVLVEAKLDGARVQLHRLGDEVRIFTRNLNDVTDRLPGVVELARSLEVRQLVLDGEAIGLADDGGPRRFQDTISEFARSDERGDVEPPLHAFFFDLLHVDGRSLHDRPLSERLGVLDSIVPAASRLPSIVTADASAAQRFFDEIVNAGQEGVLVKDLDAPYEAGRRGAAWRKVKPVHTYDLVVLAVEWGHGRRQGWLSNLHLGARDPDADGELRFVMVGKTFKGLTDELLAWQTERFQELATGTGTGRDGHVVYVRPEQVVEIAIDGVQTSSRYPGGVALRFARVRRYRDDKTPAEADTIDTLRLLRDER